MGYPTLYDILAVRENASFEEISSAYRKLASKLHPDRHVNSSPKTAGLSSERIKEVNAAYSVLSDKEKRKVYDERYRSSSYSVYDVIRMVDKYIAAAPPKKTEEEPPNTDFSKTNRRVIVISKDFPIQCKMRDFLKRNSFWFMVISIILPIDGKNEKVSFKYDKGYDNKPKKIEIDHFLDSGERVLLSFHIRLVLEDIKEYEISKYQVIQTVKLNFLDYLRADKYFLELVDGNTYDLRSAVTINGISEKLLSDRAFFIFGEMLPLKLVVLPTFENSKMILEIMGSSMEYREVLEISREYYKNLTLKEKSPKKTNSADEDDSD